MKKSLFVFLILLLSLFFIYSAEYKDVYDLSKIKASKEIVNLIKNDLLKWINSDVIVAEVEAANAKNQKRTPDEIKELDKKWSASKTIEDWMKPYFENNASKFLLEMQKKSLNLFAEIFVMDFQGCNAALSNKTSDFLQGDEDKFIKSFGSQAIFLDKIKYDESTKTSSMQVSLPIYNAKTKKVIGAITVTIDMEKKDILNKYQ